MGTLPAGISYTTSTAGGVVTVTLTGSSTLANYQTAIKAITFTVAQMDGTKAASGDVQQSLGARPQRAAEAEPEPTQAPKAKEPVDDEPPPPSSGLKKTSAPRTKKAEVPKETPAEEPAEPTVRDSGKPESPAPTKKSSLAAMVDDWDN